MEERKIKNWSMVKERLKKEYPHLSFDDLIYRAEKEEEILLQLQKRLNKNQEEIRKWLSLMG